MKTKPLPLPPIPEPGDYYYEGPYVVFTERYHIRRGYCCKSLCRHCPFGVVKGTKRADDDLAGKK